jgi:hypothetical protein
MPDDVRVPRLSNRSLAWPMPMLSENDGLLGDVVQFSRWAERAGHADCSIEDYVLGA